MYDGCFKKIAYFFDLTSGLATNCTKMSVPVFIEIEQIEQVNNMISLFNNICSFVNVTFCINAIKFGVCAVRSYINY